MSKPLISTESLTWECKQCHQIVTDDKTVAYHLIEGVLYGWCESCFEYRHAVVVTAAA
ncbi:MAG TPA: hypothetical protein VKM94_18880 [Blastocatellia bacterium]|nr:hypothetical protein [Blastocatellia bacterium]